MNELEKAKQIAAEAFNFKSKAYTTIEQQNEIIEVNRKAFMQILSLSSFTIPQSIADALDVGDLIFLAWTHGNDLLGKMSDEERNAECRRRNAIAKAYLAGKALGVDLVKVTED
ncbi:hypothetical protein [Lactococcus lactis]|uniref:Phage protein n=1 Tax=Lactococcus lactis TaxID=1358 RepID=A0AAP8E0H3_9LACT|nr:hypothetical protein [Lactococcus lactis]MDG4972313.1 hypothetical protein [Lactococcus lactis]PFG88459.1 hypothetical protein BW154_02910 [Lactococcus lactis]